MANYVPSPINTADVTLTEAQRRLVEILAANVHEVWAKKRMEEGWRYGAFRDDNAKTHPCLIPYERLPDSEKDYDRVLVEQVVRAAVALGYRIDLQSS